MISFSSEKPSIADGAARPFFDPGSALKQSFANRSSGGQGFDANRRSICLDCALPLNVPGQHQGLECSCLSYDDEPEEGLEWDGISIMLAAGFAIVLVSAFFGVWS